MTKNHSLTKRVISNIPVYFLNLQGLNNFRYMVQQNKGALIERHLTEKDSESRSYYGLSHLLEHLSFKSTAKYSTEQVSDFIKKKGYYNATTNLKKVKYFMDSTMENITSVIDVINHVAFNDMTKVSLKELEIEKNIVQQEINEYRSNIEHILNVDIEREIYTLNQHEDVLGSVQDIQNTTLEQLIEMKKHFITTNSEIYIAYDSLKMSEEYIANALKLSLKDFPNLQNKEETFFTNYIPKAFNKERIIVKSSYEPLDVRMYIQTKQHHSIPYGAAMHYLGNNSDQSLFENFREAKGLAYNAYARVLNFVGTNDRYAILAAATQKQYLDEFIQSCKESARNVLEGYNLQLFENLKDTYYIQETLKSSNPNRLLYLANYLIENGYMDYNSEELKENILQFYNQIIEKEFTLDKIRNVLEEVNDNIQNNKYTLAYNIEESEK